MTARQGVATRLLAMLEEEAEIETRPIEEIETDLRLLGVNASRSIEFAERLARGFEARSAQGLAARISKVEHALGSGWPALYARTPATQRAPDVPSNIDEAEAPTLRSILARLWHRKYLILGLTFCLTLAIAIVVANLRSFYRAQAEVAVRPQEMSIADLNVSVARPPDAAQIETEVQRIRSRGLARRVIASLNLLEDPEFNPELLSSGGHQLQRYQDRHQGRAQLFELFFVGSGRGESGTRRRECRGEGLRSVPRSPRRGCRRRLKRHQHRLRLAGSG
jgi:Chain length determinant protein